MTCFWDGILKALNDNDFQSKLKCNKPNREQLIDLFKNHNCPTLVKWQNNKLTVNELKENFDHIKTFDKKSIHNGYLCSTCDPFLLLLAELLQVDITHHYMNNVVNYTVYKPRRKLTFHSNKGHFW